MRRSLTALPLLFATPVFADTPNVVVDIAPVHSLVAQVMAGVGTPDLIMPPGASPHGYAMRPSEARALQSADLVIWVGPELTPWLDTAIDNLAGDATTLALFDLPETMKLESRSLARFADGEGGHDDHDHGAHEDHDNHDDHDDHAEHKEHDDDDHEDHAEHKEHDDHDHEDHAEHEEHHDDDAHDHAEHKEHDDDDHEDHAEHDDHEDHDHAEHKDDDHDDHDDHAGHDDHDDHDHGPEDAHAWLDPANASVWLASIADALSAADPENAATYAANAKAAQADIATLSATITAKLAPVHDAQFLVYHDAYQYFENRFDLNATGAIAAGDTSAPSAQRIAILRDAVEDQDIACIFSEPQFSATLVTALQDGTDLRSETLDPVGLGLTPGPDLYAELLNGLAETMAHCLDDDHNH